MIRQLFFALIVIIAAVTYAGWHESYDIEVHHVLIESFNAINVLHGKTAVHLSDLHISSIGKREKDVLQLIDSIKPDFIFLTGDYVPWNGDYGPAFTFLSLLKARIGIWAVMGDYDYSKSRDSCLFCHEHGTGKPTRRHAIHFLRNSVEHITLPQGDIVIGGVEFPAEYPLGADWSLAFVRKTAPAIILSHSPLLFNSLNTQGDVLILSGDTHGGQIPLFPWLWGFLGYEKNARYNQGFFQEGKKKMYVSRGIGTSHLPIRIFEKPELVVIHF
jgi:predicted MPP superfamily phosphohydrolase